MSNWSTGGRTINALVLPYGRYFASVPEFRLYTQSEQPEVTNHAGAAAPDLHNALAAELEAHHGSVLDGGHLGFYNWAGYILSLPRSQQDAAKSQLPPAHVINQFVLRSSGPAAQLEAMNRALGVTEEVLKEYDEHVSGVLGKVEEALVTLSFAKETLRAAQIGIRAYKRVVSAVKLGATPQEGSLAESIAGRVRDGADTDH